MINTRVTQSDLFSMKENEDPRLFILDQGAFVVAKQMIVNRKQRYPGCDISLTKIGKTYNSPLLFIVEGKRIAYGKSVDGFDEPKEYSDYDYTIAKARRRARKEADKADQ